MKYVPFIGRIFYSIIFIAFGLSHIFKLGEMSQYTASMGVPLPTVATLVTGLMILAGGLSILLGYKVKIGAILLIVFLIPTSFIANAFWTIQDAMQAQMHLAMFMKNIAMTGGALIFFYFGTGPLSIEKQSEK